MNPIEPHEMPWVHGIKSAQDFFRWAACRLGPGYDPFATARVIVEGGGPGFASFYAAALYNDLRDVAENYMADANLPLLDWIRQQ